MLLVVLGLLDLHLPHYLVETASPAGYATYPGLVLVILMARLVLDSQVG